MNVESVNVGLPREIFHRGRVIRSAILKTPVAGRVRVNALNLAGDQQDDPTVHGGPNKAVYAYPIEHYEFWRSELSGVDLPMGSFGENLTTAGLIENDLNIGDRLCVGSAELIVTEPRLPCDKLNARFTRPDMVKKFLHSRRTGFYFAVAREGEVGAGDPVHFLSREENTVSVADITRLYAFDKNDLAGMRRAVEVPALPDGWRSYFCERLRSRRDENPRMCYHGR
jgi:MOSC domain-containing protein YiiM